MPSTLINAIPLTPLKKLGTLMAKASVADAREIVRKTPMGISVVFDENGHLFGVLTQQAIDDVDEKWGSRSSDLKITYMVDRTTVTCIESDNATTILDKIEAKQTTYALVIRSGSVLGMVSADDLRLHLPHEGVSSGNTTASPEPEQHTDEEITPHEPVAGPWSKVRTKVKARTQSWRKLQLKSRSVPTDAGSNYVPKSFGSTRKPSRKRWYWLTLIPIIAITALVFWPTNFVSDASKALSASFRTALVGEAPEQGIFLHAQKWNKNLVTYIGPSEQPHLQERTQTHLKAFSVNSEPSNRTGKHRNKAYLLPV